MRPWFAVWTAIVGLSGASLAHSEDRYQYVGGNSDIQVFLNIDKIVVGGDWTQEWMLSVFPNATFMMTKSQDNCVHETNQRLYSILFSSNGSELQHESYTDMPVPISPGSTGTTIFAYVCKHRVIEPKLTMQSEQSARKIGAILFKVKP